MLQAVRMAKVGAEKLSDGKCRDLTGFEQTRTIFCSPGNPPLLENRHDARRGGQMAAQ